MTLREIATALRHESGHDTPRQPTLPPLDVSEQCAATVLLALSRLGVALGVELDTAVTRSVVPGARSTTDIQDALLLLLLSAELAVVDLGFALALPPEPPASILAAFRQLAQRASTIR